MDLLTIAKKIADRVEAESFKQNVPVAVTVIDIHGNVVPHPPHDRSARILPRALRAESLHVRARPHAHRWRQGGVLDSSALAAARRIVPAPPTNARRHGATPSISVSSEKLRNVLITTISPST